MTPQVLSAMIGEEATFALLSQRAGLRVYVPKRMTARFLEEVGGDEKAALALINEMGGLFLTIPSAKRWRAARLKRAGVSIRDAALQLGITRVHAVTLYAETQVCHEQAGAKMASRAA